jgi:hypothetical protein
MTDKDKNNSLLHYRINYGSKFLLHWYRYIPMKWSRKRFSTRVGSGLTRKYKFRPKKLASNKRANLNPLSVKNIKRFIIFAPIVVEETDEQQQ